MGGRPSNNSMLRSMELVVYRVLSTTRRRLYGLKTRPMVRRASTWSEPFCASSSMMKIAVSFQ